MKIKTTYYGELEIDESKLINFSNGLLGFQPYKKFALLDIEGNPHFHFLQSIDDKELSFVVTNPYLFYKNYEFDLDESLVEDLKIEKPEQIIVLTILTLKQPFEQSTINLKAPLVINSNNNVAKQIVIKENDYHTKHPIKGGE